MMHTEQKKAENRQNYFYLHFFIKKVAKKFVSIKNGSNFAPLFNGDIV